MRLADRQSGKFARIEQTTDGTLPRFDWEQSFLTDTTIEQALDSVPADAKSLFQFASHNIASDIVLDLLQQYFGWHRPERLRCYDQVMDGSILTVRQIWHTTFKYLLTDIYDQAG